MMQSFVSSDVGWHIRGYYVSTKCVTPWNNRNGWLGVKHQITYLLGILGTNCELSLPIPLDPNKPHCLCGREASRRKKKMIQDVQSTPALWAGLVGWVLLYVHRNHRLIRDGGRGRPPRLSHSSWALMVWSSGKALGWKVDDIGSTLASALLRYSSKACGLQILLLWLRPPPLSPPPPLPRPPQWPKPYSVSSRFSS